MDKAEKELQAVDMVDSGTTEHAVDDKASTAEDVPATHASALSNEADVDDLKRRLDSAMADPTALGSIDLNELSNLMQSASAGAVPPAAKPENAMMSLMRSIFSMAAEVSQANPEELSMNSVTTQISRLATANVTGVCTVCNNLQPDGHEDSFSNPNGGLKDQSHDPRIRAARTEFGKKSRALDLPQIDVGEIKGSAKGVPYRGRQRPACRYCRFI